MQFWRYDLNNKLSGANPSRFQDNSKLKIDYSNQSLGAKILKKQFLEFKATHWPHSPLDLRNKNSRIYYQSPRRYLAKFGGFFSFRSSARAGKNIFINGFSFFSIASKRGWNFLSFDNFPWNAKKLNKLFYKVFSISGGLPLFDRRSVSGELRGEQPRNFAFHYKAHNGLHLFSARRYRDDEAFKIFYEQQAMAPVILSTPSADNQFQLTPHSLIFDAEHFLMSRLSSKNFSGSYGNSVNNDNILMRRPVDYSKSFFYPYAHFVNCFSSSSFATVLHEVFDFNTKLDSLRTDVARFYNEGDSPFWFFQYALRISRLYSFTPRIFDKQLYLWSFFYSASNFTNVRAKRPLSARSIRRRRAWPFSSLGLPKSISAAKSYLKCVFGRNFSNTKKFVRTSRQTRIFKRLSKRRVSRGTIFNFLARLNKVHRGVYYNYSTNNASSPLAAVNVLASILPKKIRRKYIGRRNRFSHTYRAGNWHRVPRTLIGRKNRKRMILSGR